FGQHTTHFAGDLAFSLEALTKATFEPREKIIRQRHSSIEDCFYPRFAVATHEGIGIVSFRQKCRAPQQAGFDKDLKAPRRRLLPGVIAVESRDNVLRITR